jgi:hypothetical protein
MTKWIKVRKQLPKPGEIVMVKNRKGQKLQISSDLICWLDREPGLPDNFYPILLCDKWKPIKQESLDAN